MCSVLYVYAVQGGHMSEVMCHSVNASWSMLYACFSTDTHVTFDNHACSHFTRGHIRHCTRHEADGHLLAVGGAVCMCTHSGHLVAMYAVHKVVCGYKAIVGLFKVKSCTCLYLQLPRLAIVRWPLRATVVLGSS